MLLTVQEPVTGGELITDEREPLAALSEFYRALNSRDIALMERNWEAGDQAVMNNPLGGIKRGWADIRSVYESLFASPGYYRFEFYDYSLQRFSEIFIAIGRERGHLASSSGPMLELAFRTTRIFRCVNHRFRQIHHHGSIDDPDMLARYQQTVLKTCRLRFGNAQRFERRNAHDNQ